MGVKYKFEINRQGFLLGLEAMYDHGFNNTYGKQEIDGKSNDVGNLVEYNHDKLKGERCFKGMSRIDVWNSTIKSVRKASPADLNLMLMRSSRYQQIKRNGVCII